MQTYCPYFRFKILTMKITQWNSWFITDIEHAEYYHLVFLIKKLVIIISYETEKKKKKKQLFLNFCLEFFFLEECPNHVKVWTRFSNFGTERWKLFVFNSCQNKEVRIKYEQKDVMCSRQWPRDWSEMKVDVLGCLRYGTHAIQPCPMGNVI